MPGNNTLNNFHPFAYVASLADANTMHLAEAMQQPDRDEFVKAITKEIADHTNHKHWSIHTCEHM
jgi:hypothetical protein